MISCRFHQICEIIHSSRTFFFYRYCNTVESDSIMDFCAVTACWKLVAIR